MLVSIIAKKTGLPTNQISSVVDLLSDGATIPFIARYRKERTGGLDELALASILSEKEKFRELEKRKKTILSTIEGQGLLSQDLKSKIDACWDATLLEDLYLPFKKKAKTKATIAREKGLEPLAKIIMAQHSHNIREDAKRFTGRDISTMDDAIRGAQYIVAEWVNENVKARDIIRQQFERYAIISSTLIKAKKAEAEKFQDYFDFNQPLKKIPSHRFLAILRGEKEALLRTKISIDEDRAQERLSRFFIRRESNSTPYISDAIKDALKRLMLPSLSTEFKNQAKEKADKEAIRVFTENLKNLLLASPLGPKNVMGLDPGFRTGCKLVCISQSMALLAHDTIYPNPPQSKTDAARYTIDTLIKKHNIEAIAIGNGTAGRETFQFVKSITKGREIEVFMVNESGASIYSASAIAREEFPNHDVTVRGSVSIARRLIDPLAELVKIDPKSIGVGQYQHDVNQKNLKESLNQTVEYCVNAVGININTASKHLLTHVSGLGPTLAENIEKYRYEKGSFSTIQELENVPRMGKKAYEQCAGFLRIKDGKNPLDNTAVHPESYHLVEKMARDCGVPLETFIHDKKQRQGINLKQYVSDKAGLPTLQDILEAIDKKGLDPRGAAKTVSFAQHISKIEDLKIGVKLTGIVNNVTKFGAFVDIGIKESGLVHISQITDRYISDPAEILSVNQEVQVQVLDLDIPRKRISLTMKF